MHPLTLSDGREQVMWPAHCVQLSKGAEFHHDLVIDSNNRIIRKGVKADVDSYSAFSDNDHKSKTELTDILRKAGITDVVLVGLCYDFSIAFTALDAVKEGFRTWICEDATRAVSEENIKKMKSQLKQVGVHSIKTDMIPDNAQIPEPDDDEEKVDEEGESDNEEETKTTTTTTAPPQVVVDDFLSLSFNVPTETQQPSTEEPGGEKNYYGRSNRTTKCRYIIK